jgi:uncharacterized protein (DUF1800 family)
MIIMNSPDASIGFRRLRELLRAIAAFLSLLLFIQPAFVVMVGAQRRVQRDAKKERSMTEDRRIAQVVSRLTFGARPGDFERVKAMGVDAFIAQQLDPDSIDDEALQAKLGKLPTLAMATPVIIEQYTPPKPVASPSPSPSPVKPIEKTSPSPVAQNSGQTITTGAGEAVQAEMKMDSMKNDAGKMTGLPNPLPEPSPSPAATPKPMPPAKNPQMVVTELQRAAMLRAVYSERQLYELMVDYWENHFSIFAYKDADRYLLTSFDRDTIRPFALGRFRDLLGATAHSPAMLFYLDNWQSSLQRNYPATKDKPARTTGGVNENYARELMELHTLGVDGGYTQKDVQEVARCFTGWTIQKPNEEGLFLFRPGAHDDGEKIVLGHRIPAGGGISDGERVLDILATHPSTAGLIATKLARRFISDEPPQSVIDRAAKVFLKTDGSIRETLRAIITSPEFFSAATYRAKVRTPFEYVVAALRALNAQTEVDPALVDWTRRMGQQVFGRLTPDGYPDRAEQWMAPGSMLERFNFANALATNRIKGTRIDISRLLSDGDDARSVANHLTRALLMDDLSPQTRQALANISQKIPTVCAPNVSVKGVSYASEKDKEAKPAQPCVAEIAEEITILIGSPEFQRR